MLPPESHSPSVLLSANQHCHSTLLLLLEAHERATEQGASSWAFALELECLTRAAECRIWLRVLLQGGYTLHAHETTRSHQSQRCFANHGSALFIRRSCFVLSESGMEAARLLRTARQCSGPWPGSSVLVSVSSPVQSVPVFKQDTHELWLGERLVKRFRQPAPDQETVLAAFQEEGWPVRIDNPLPAGRAQTDQQRLHQTIHRLNRQQHDLLRFRGDGTGEGVCWEWVERMGGAVCH